MTTTTNVIRSRRFYERGVYFYEQGKWADATINLRDALALMPSFVAARMYLGSALGKQKKFLEAIRILEDGRRQPHVEADTQRQLLSLLGLICLVRQDYPAAKYYLNAAIKFAPNDPLLRHRMATTLCKSGAFNEGLDLFLQSTRDNPEP